MPTITDRIWTVRHSEIIQHFILNSENVVISGHTNPDGDSIGAMLSLGLGLQSIGKQVFMVCPDPIPKKYRHLPGIDQVVKTTNHKFDLAIAVDCGSKEMIGPSFEIFKNAKTILEIDHHRSRTPFGDLSFVDPDASSAGELVYELLLDLEIPVTTEIAQNILTSIMVETNSFRLPGIRPHTFQLCAELLRAGVDFFQLAEAVYWVTSKETAVLSGICMSRCQFESDGQIAWSILYNRDFKKAGACDADADPITEKIRSIQGVKIAILIREKNSKFLRVSLRSKENINVASIAELFGGGGHISAAGCTIPNQKSAIKELLDHARQIICNHIHFPFMQESLISDDPLQHQPEKKVSVIPAIILLDQLKESKHPVSEWEENEIDLSYFEKRLEHKVAL